MFTYLWETSTKQPVNSQSGVISLHTIIFTFWHTLLFSLCSHLSSLTIYSVWTSLKRKDALDTPWLEWVQSHCKGETFVLYFSTKFGFILEFPLAAAGTSVAQPEQMPDSVAQLCLQRRNYTAQAKEKSSSVCFLPILSVETCSGPSTYFW